MVAGRCEIAHGKWLIATRLSETTRIILKGWIPNCPYLSLCPKTRIPLRGVLFGFHQILVRTVRQSCLPRPKLLNFYKRPADRVLSAPVGIRNLMRAVWHAVEDDEELAGLQFDNV